MRDRVLEELIRWLGECLGKLERHAGDEERVRSTLRCLRHACDPSSNPRLKAALESRPRRPEVRDPAAEVRAGVRRALAEGWERQRRKARR